jgi:hypothetical protein
MISWIGAGTYGDGECGGCCSWNDKWKPSEVLEDGNDE